MKNKRCCNSNFERKTFIDDNRSLFIFVSREKQSALIIHREKESLQSNVRQLVYVVRCQNEIFAVEINYFSSFSEVNNKLRDENDTLREMIDSSKPTSEVCFLFR